jgi:hypothetical protein
MDCVDICARSVTSTHELFSHMYGALEYVFLLYSWDGWMLLLPDVSKFQLVTLGAGGSDPGPN